MTNQTETNWVEIGLMEYRSTITLAAYLAQRADPAWNWRAIQGTYGFDPES